jgi:hypothetical protein
MADTTLKMYRQSGKDLSETMVAATIRRSATEMLNAI